MQVLQKKIKYIDGIDLKNNWSRKALFSNVYTMSIKISNINLKTNR